MILLPTSLHHNITEAWNGLGGPDDYDECILNNMKGTTSDIAARAIYRSCREKFPEEVEVYESLPREALASVSGRGSINEIGSFRGKIHNGSGWAIKEMKIAIKDNKSGDIKEYNEGYTINGSSFMLSPNEVGFLDFMVIDSPDDISWWIVSAKGKKEE